MNKETYQEKMLELLDSNDYKKCKRNPTARIQLALRTALKEVEYKGMISTPMKKRLTPYHSLTPQIYGLPKIHKPNIPLRPIVCTIDSPTYEVAKMIAKILTPLIGHTNSYIRDSAHFVEELKEWKVNEHDLMVSFDVKSLFTNVPINDVLVILMERLQLDETLVDRTAMDPLSVCHLTELCLHSTYFAFQGQIYQQQKGTAMGSPLSPVVANIFMEDFETTALATADYSPTIWKQYVDDTFVIWPHGRDKLETFLSHINSLHDSILFIMEIEEGKKIAFLDVQIYRNNNNILETSVYRKPTHTNQYLNFRSHHHPRVKFGIVQCLSQRARKICSLEARRKKEMKLIKEVFVANGYPKKKVDEIMKKRPSEKENTTKDDTGKHIPLLVLPYMQGLSENMPQIQHQDSIHCSSNPQEPFGQSERPTTIYIKTGHCLLHSM